MPVPVALTVATASVPVPTYYTRTQVINGTELPIQTVPRAPGASAESPALRVLVLVLLTLLLTTSSSNLNLNFEQYGILALVVLLSTSSKY